MTEVEIKLGVPAGFELPGLDGVVPGASLGPADHVHLDAVYYDTVDRRLTNAGASLRHRREGDGPGTWTVKLPVEVASGAGLSRSEIDIRHPPGAIPGEAVELVAPIVKGAALEPVARLRSRRIRWILSSPDGGRLAELDLDDVDVLRGDEVVARFAELEVEQLGDGDAAVLEAVVERLRAAGAGEADPMPKVARALLLAGS